VDENETSLSCVKQQMRAQAGGNGRGKGMHGAGGNDLVVRVPRGTMVREIREGQGEPAQSLDGGFLDGLEKQVQREEGRRMNEKNALFVHYPRWEDRNDLKGVRIPAEFKAHLWALRHGEPISVDLVAHGQRALVAGGGLGGLGNPHFNAPGDRQPHYALRGLAGFARTLDLELKTIADVGLVGMPNAGKSTFLRSVSNAHPQVAPYPFTTLNPYIGTVDFADSWQLTIADIPGLVPGAHRNVGLGHSFLRHVERSRLLVFIVDVASPAPWADYQALRHELELYSPELVTRPSVVVANKADAGPMARDNFERWQRMIPDGVPLIPVSAKFRKNILKATHTIRQVLLAMED
ncbi:GTPase of the mitochondrial inner membrane that associates with the large ribosomal subunit, partial [Coemansia asiatica]